MSSPKSRLAEAEIPEHCCSHTFHRISVVETDLMGIVHHANYVALFERGRLEYLRRRALPYKAMVERGFHMPVVELNVRYRKPARFEDVLRLETRLGAASRVTVRFDYVVSREQPDPAERELLVEASVLLACVDERTRPRKLPDDVLEGLLLPEQQLAGSAAFTPGSLADPAGIS